MRKEILKLLSEEKFTQQKMSNLNADRNVYLTRILLVRELMEIRRQINLFTVEEIYTAKNYFKLKRQLYIKKLKRLALIQASEDEEYEEEKHKAKEVDFLEAYFMFLMLQQTNNDFMKLGEVITTIKIEEYYAKKTNKFTTKKK